MFTVFAYTVNQDGEPGPANSTGLQFAERREAEAHLNNMIANISSSGFNEEQGYWWTRNAETLTRYTIQ